MDMGNDDLKQGEMGGSLLVTCNEARLLLGGISSTTLNRWANEWGLRKVGHRFVRSDIVDAVSQYSNKGKDGNKDSAVYLRS